MGAIKVPLTNKYKLRVQGEEIGTRLIRITRKIKWDCLGDTSATQIDFFFQEFLALQQTMHLIQEFRSFRNISFSLVIP